MFDADQVLYLHEDHLGSTTAITRADGTVFDARSYGPFGLASTGNWTTESTLSGYTGHTHDADLGLVNMRGRLYDPKLGRFITADPFVTEPLTAGGLNRYSYVQNNPSKFVDPSGFEAFEGVNPYYTDCTYFSDACAGGSSGMPSSAEQARQAAMAQAQEQAMAAERARAQSEAGQQRMGEAAMFAQEAGRPGWSQPTLQDPTKQPVGTRRELAGGDTGVGSGKAWWQEYAPESWPTEEAAQDRGQTSIAGAGKAAGRVIRLGIQAFSRRLFRKAGRAAWTGTRLTSKELAAALEAGEDVVADSARIAKELSLAAGRGRHPTLHEVTREQLEQGFLPHYHPAGSKPHVFFEPHGGYGLKTLPKPAPITDTLDDILPGIDLLVPIRRLRGAPEGA